MSKKEDIEKMENLNNEEVKRESAEKDIKNEKVQNLLKEAKEKGAITYEDLAKQLDGVNPDQIDSVFDAFQEIGVDLLDEDDFDEEPDIEDLKEVENLKIEDFTDSSFDGISVDDPVRMYLERNRKNSIINI